MTQSTTYAGYAANVTEPYTATPGYPRKVCAGMQGGSEMRCQFEVDTPRRKRNRSHFNGDADSDNCQREARVQIAQMHFCTQHAVIIRRDHERILARIRSIPCR